MSHSCSCDVCGKTDVMRNREVVPPSWLYGYVYDNYDSENDGIAAACSDECSELFWVATKCSEPSRCVVCRQIIHENSTTVKKGVSCDVESSVNWTIIVCGEKCSIRFWQHGPGDIRAMGSDEGKEVTTVFVFGSNRAGRHGKGAALSAMKWSGAVYRQGEGLQGQAYAIPTKDEHLVTLPIREIEKHVRTFLYFACMHPELDFMVTRIGCGLAGYSDEHIAPLFRLRTPNVQLDERWLAVLAG